MTKSIPKRKTREAPRRPKVLLVDDDPGITMVLEQGLTEQGFTILAVKDGLQALELMLTEKPDLVLLDVMMPGLDGFEICRKLKESPATSRTPLVFLTARATSADIQRGLSLGADDYVTKPFDIYQLGSRLLDLLKKGGKPLPLREGTSDL